MDHFFRPVLRAHCAQLPAGRCLQWSPGSLCRVPHALRLLIFMLATPKRWVPHPFAVSKGCADDARRRSDLPIEACCETRSKKQIDAVVIPPVPICAPCETHHRVPHPLLRCCRQKGKTGYATRQVPASEQRPIPAKASDRAVREVVVATCSFPSDFRTENLR